MSKFDSQSMALFRGQFVQSLISVFVVEVRATLAAESESTFEQFCELFVNHFRLHLSNHYALTLPGNL